MKEVGNVPVELLTDMPTWAGLLTGPTPDSMTDLAKLLVLFMEGEADMGRGVREAE